MNKFGIMFNLSYLILIFSGLLSIYDNQPSNASVTPNTTTPTLAAPTISFPVSDNSNLVGDVSNYPNTSEKQTDTTPVQL